MDSPNAVTRSFSPKRVADICEVTARLYEKMEKMSSRQGDLQLPNEVIRGFKAMLAFNIFGYYQAAALFPEPQRSQQLAFFESFILNTNRDKSVNLRVVYIKNIYVLFRVFLHLLPIIIPKQYALLK